MAGIHLIMIGGGGHARVLLDILREGYPPVAGFTAPSSKPDLGIEYLGQDDKIDRCDRRTTRLVNGLGSVHRPLQRQAVFEQFKDKGLTFQTVRHSRAVIAEGVVLGEGVQVMAGAVLNPGVVLGDNVIINTGAVVDHDGVIGAHTHIAPGAVLSGGVTVGCGCHIGTGAVIIQGVTLGVGVVVGAGAVVVRDVADGKTVLGVPARETGDAAGSGAE